MHVLGMILLILLWWTSSGAEAACTGASPTWTASNDNVSVQSCVDQAINGDTINIAAGTSLWTDNVRWTNKQIHVKGAGQGVTIIQQGGFGVTMTAGGIYNWRISDLTLQITNMTTHLRADSQGTTSPTKGWRIDHITVTHSGTASQALMSVLGITWGLIDHVTFNGSSFQPVLMYGYMGSSVYESDTCSPHCMGYWYWNRNLNLGTDEALYIEDCLVDFDGTGFVGVIDADYGGAYVIRYSTINGTYFQTHSTGHVGHNYGGMKYEVYNNTFTGRGQYRWGLLRSGSGVVFNNTVSGYSVNHTEIDGQRESGNSCSQNVSSMYACTGTSAYDGNIESTGWPCVSSCGRGAAAGFDGTAKTQTNVPLYGWNNGSTATCASGGACDNTVMIRLNSSCTPGAQQLSDYFKTTGTPHANGQVDYVNNGSTPKPGYTPFNYPHPLTAGGGGNTTTPPPPTGLTVK